MAKLPLAPSAVTSSSNIPYLTQMHMHTLQVTPSKYDLLLKPDLKQFTFEGEVKIHVDVSEETNTVSLHAKEVIVIYRYVVMYAGRGVRIF